MANWARGMLGHSSSARQEEPADRGPVLLLFPPRLWPAHYEGLFWSCEFTQRVFRDKDNQMACIHIFHDMLFLLRFCAGVPRPADSVFRAVAATMVVLTLLHIAMRLCIPYEYKSCRWVLIVHRRLFYAVGFMSNLEAISNAASTKSASSRDADVLASYQLFQGSTRMSTFRALLIFSGSPWNLIHALPFTVPFALEVLIQLVYLSSTFHYLAPLSAAYFSAPRYTPNVRAVCHTLAATAQPPWAMLPPMLTPALRRLCDAPSMRAACPAAAAAIPPQTTPSPPHICDSPQAPWVLLIFCQLFAGFLLTLYLAYFCERHLKLRFLQHLRNVQAADQPLPPPHHPPRPPLAPALSISAAAAEAPAAGAGPSTAQAHDDDGLPWPQQQTHLLCPQAEQGRDPPATSDPLILPQPPGPPSQPPSTANPQGPPRMRLARALARALVGSSMHMLRLWLLVAVAWHLVVACHKPLATLVSVVEFQGGSLEWYWQLMCDGDRWPCCQATDGL